jgi:cytochrome P450
MFGIARGIPCLCLGLSGVAPLSAANYVCKRGLLTLATLQGNDTTSTLIRDMCIEIFQRPECQQRIRSANLLENPRGHTEQNFVTACIKETLRHTPPLAASLPRKISPGGVQLGDIFVPEGFEVYGSVYTLQHDKEIFGHDVDEWKPERWLPRPGVDAKSERERVTRMDHAIYAWGYGARICLGKPLAEMEAFMTIQKLLNAFDVELVLEPGFHEQGWFGLRRHRGMLVKLTKRDREK